jgi:hypothetical protein
MIIFLTTGENEPTGLSAYTRKRTPSFAVRQGLGLVSAAPLPHQFHVTLKILVAKGRLLPTVSTLIRRQRQPEPRRRPEKAM